MNDLVPDVFISYSSKDREWVSNLAQALKANNYRVWWDQDLVGGQNFHKDISQMLDNSRCVVVVWSENSIKSTWVQGEADQASLRDVLIPVTYQPARIPIAFSSLHSIDFHSWNGGSIEACFQQLIRAVEYKIDDNSNKLTDFRPLGISQEIMRTVKSGEKKRGCSVSMSITLCLCMFLSGIFWYQMQDDVPTAYEQVTVDSVYHSVTPDFQLGRGVKQPTDAEKAFVALYLNCTNRGGAAKIVANADALIIKSADSRIDTKISMEYIDIFVENFTIKSSYKDKSVRDCMESYASLIGSVVSEVQKKQ